MGADKMLKQEMFQKTKDVDSAIELLLNSIASVNETIMNLSSDELKKGNWEKTQQCNEKSNYLVRITKDLLTLKSNWGNLFIENTGIKKAPVVNNENVKNETKAPDKPIYTINKNTPSTKKEGYTCKGNDFIMEFVSSGGSPYSVKLPKFVFKEIGTYTAKYLEVNPYIQARDVLSVLEQYLLDNTNYKEVKSLVSKALRCLLNQGLLKNRNGRTGYYELSGTVQDILDFLNEFDEIDTY